MKVKLNVNARAQIELDAETPKDLIRQLSAFQEVLIETECGDCGSDRVRYEHRVRDANEYYSMRCLVCDATLDFGQHRTGETLFVERDKGKSGWYHFQREQTNQY